MGREAINVGKRLSFPLLLCACLMGFTSTNVHCDDWPTWRGADRQGYCREKNLDLDWSDGLPPVVWRTNIGIGFSSMVASDHRLYSLGNTNEQDTLYCIDASDGSVKWQYEYTAPLDDRYFEGGPTSTPLIDGAHVYSLSRAGELFCLDRLTGKLVWSKNFPEELGVDVPGWGFSGAPVAFDDKLVLNVGESGLAIDKGTGEVLWHSEGESGYMTPLVVPVAGRDVTIIASGKFYQGIDVRDGSVLWRQRWLTNFGCNAADPIFHAGELFISSGYNRGSALLRLSSESAEVVWETKELQNQWATSILRDGYLYGIDGNDTSERFLKCVDFKSGKVLWSEANFGSASLLGTDDALLILADDGRLVVADFVPQSFSSKGTMSILEGKCWTAPIISNGYLFARSAIGDVVCIDLRKR